MIHGFLESNIPMNTSDQENAHRKVAVRSLTGLEEFEGEEQIPQDIKRALPIIQKHITAKQEEFGLKRCSFSEPLFRYVKEALTKGVSLDRVHFLSEEAYLKDIADMDTGVLSYGNYDMKAKAIILRNRENSEKNLYRNDFEKRLDLLKMFQHEALHMVSYESDYALGGKEVDIYRQGYMVFNPKHKFERFRGLNEAVVETMNVTLFAQEISDFREEFGDEESEREWHRGRKIYERYRMVLESIIENIAEHKEQEPREIWRNFEKGLFTGKMGHLKAVDEVYGLGSLRILASMGSYDGETTREKPDTRDLSDWIIEQQDSYVYYFSKPREAGEKNEIARELLSDKEYERFLKKQADTQ